MTDIVTIRASSLSSMMDCAKRWHAQNIMGIRMPSSGAAHLGTSLHASTAAYDSAKLDGTPITADDAAGVLVDTLYHPEEDVDWSDMDKGPKGVEDIALTLHTRYCGTVSNTHEYVAVEATCEALDVEVPEHGITIRLTGTTDRIRKTTDGRLGVADIKSGQRAVGTDGVATTKGHGPQLAVYELLAEHSLGQPIEAPAEIIGLQTTKQCRIGTGVIETPRAGLIGTEDEPGLIEIAAGMLKAGLMPPNPKSMLCSARYCPVHATCRYHD